MLEGRAEQEDTDQTELFYDRFKATLNPMMKKIEHVSAAQTKVLTQKLDSGCTGEDLAELQAAIKELAGGCKQLEVFTDGSTALSNLQRFQKGMATQLEAREKELARAEQKKKHKQGHVSESKDPPKLVRNLRADIEADSRTQRVPRMWCRSG